jgi:hypothetical protein
VRSGGDYELTPRAREMRHELGLLLPRPENLVAGRSFDPATATGVMRIVGTDYTAVTLGPHLLPRLYQAALNLEIRIEPQHSFCPQRERTACRTKSLSESCSSNHHAGASPPVARQVRHRPVRIALAVANT